MEGWQRRELIERYRQGARAVFDAVASLESQTGLDLADETGLTAAQRIHLLADTEMIEGLRLRRILREEQPVFAESNTDTREDPERAVEYSLAVFLSAALANTALAGRISEEDWQRFGSINGTVRYTAEDWLLKMSGFAHEQAAAIERARRSTF